MKQNSSLVRFEKRGSLGLVTLTRPEALNALNVDMVEALRSALSALATDEDVRAVALWGEGPRAFCAGGDIKAVREASLEGNLEMPYRLWSQEYLLNDEIARYPKPFVSFIHGVCMGGGVGLAMHGRYRVAADDFLFAMPEVGIGYYPDVGGTHVLARLEGHYGLWLALTGARVKADAAHKLGLVTHRAHGSREAFEPIIEALANGGEVHEVLDNLTVKIPQNDGGLPSKEAVHAIFGLSSLEEIESALVFQSDHVPFAAEALKGWRMASPTSIFKQMQSASHRSLREILIDDLRISMHMLVSHDFIEGIRAAVVDKDRNPQWSPSELKDVDPSFIASLVSPLDRDLTF
jgi:enoyl-CoA hydratase